MSPEIKLLLTHLLKPALICPLYKWVRPYIAEKVADSSSRVDDWCFEAFDKIMTKVMGCDVLEGQLSREELIAQAKSAIHVETV